ncbi:hypothetical protein B5X24_HaOG212846 [Helicoverpa armigera]|nr:hypothetical protein B5X24_HaOG212846 [Helicoverpa armigera]
MSKRPTLQKILLDGSNTYQWVTALNEHIAYSGHYLWAGASPDSAREATEDLEDECKPLGSMQDALTAATNSLALLDTQLRECGAIVAALDKSVNVGNSLHHSAYMRFQHACGTGSEALQALRHCAALVAQARDADTARLNRESKRKKKSKSSSTLNDSKENFFDVFEESEDEDDTLVTAGLSSPLGALSPWGSSPDLTRRTPIGSLDGDKTPTNEEQDERYERRLSGSSGGSPVSLHTAVSAASSRGTLVSQGGHVYRNARPYRKNAHPRIGNIFLCTYLYVQRAWRHPPESEDEDDTLVTAGLSSPLGALSPWGSSPDLTRRTPIGSLDGDKTPTNEEQDERYERRLSGSSGGSPVSLHTAVSAASSRGTLVSQGGHVYRNARPYRKNAHPSSQWSL